MAAPTSSKNLILKQKSGEYWSIRLLDNPTGVGQLYEVVKQLRGEHPNQVTNASLGLAQNVGGAGVACTVSILERTDV